MTAPQSAALPFSGAPRLTKSAVLRGRQYSDEERFWSRVDRSGEGCWNWLGSHTKGGYSIFALDGTTIAAHRWAYQATCGPIPAGLTLDHLCRNPGCVNPAHLEPVTQAENIRRGSRATATRCIKRGHPYDEINTRWVGGKRQCRACSRLLWRAAYWRRKARP